ncbi:MULTISPECIES: preprotein translocase subunit SecY [Arthrospira]|jgi:preprotein translocase subunit SecY|uniref:Protein translocase subunit SecY n=1 Tax=Limnospira platensis NIES-46 TaxID=1236695 RepID=A0A5M3T233_LIMPL|nr:MULTISPECIES: preprotein translocase subunit SecY [Arthrospira]KDR56834.1 preprotein translocase subunit SecY [Arthrospira platensis str. Paraca]MBD2668416.1 preprotein translocase subunit SecY [Arthrospira platensis FACHB-439]MBD2711435.1 preprotein translocase subunit SecY [Arthrospira platensis FACHB-835]MDF2209356.1 preprotein translocase subunit SecY [Arthrospira platensis NCB002]MDT9182020.1 preprotein translocase subunit SecY [Limnospira sp. PMC 289.06]MDT9294101.1 preprotein transl
MVVSREKTPTAQETFMQMAQAAGLRGRILVTIGLLILVRLGVFLPIPGIDRQAFSQNIQNTPFIGFLDLFSGGGFSALGIFALGILPYINASIIMQLMTAALPTLEDLQKNEGEAGRRKISQITRYVALGWAILQSIGIAIWVSPFAQNPNQPQFIVMAEVVLALAAGSMFVMWVSELITERGIGNGASLLIFINIVAVLPQSLGSTIELAQSGDSAIVGRVVILLLIFLAMIVGIVFVQEGTRRIPIVSARRQVGRKLYREKSSYLPLRLNQGGVMPIIFASAVLILPASISQFANNPILVQISTYLSPGGPAPWVYIAFYLLMILFFSYFYASLIMNPVDMAQNLKKMGASIPGIRPGRATSEYIERVLNRLTFLGAVFLGLVAIIPTVVESATRVPTFRGFGATSLLILVGVAIDTAKQVQTYVISQRYEGMVKK